MPARAINCSPNIDEQSIENNIYSGDNDDGSGDDGNESDGGGTTAIPANIIKHSPALLV